MLSSQLTVGVVCYSWTNKLSWDLKVELRSCCGSEWHTRDPPTHSGIFALWSPAQSCCCGQTEVLLDLCWENVVMRLKWQDRQEEGWKWTFTMISVDLIEFISTFSSSFQDSSFSLCLFIVIIPFCPLWKVETSQVKQTEKRPQILCMLWVWQWHDSNINPLKPVREEDHFLLLWNFPD